VSEARINGDPFAPDLLAPNYGGSAGAAYTGTGAEETYTVEVRPPETAAEVLRVAEARYRAAGQAREDIDSLLQALMENGITPDDIQRAVENTPRRSAEIRIMPDEVQITPLGGPGDFITRCREVQDYIQNQMMQSMGVPRELLVGEPGGQSTANMRLAQQQLQEMHRRGIVSERTMAAAFGLDPAGERPSVDEVNTVFVNRATASDIQAAWGNELAENALVEQMWNSVVYACGNYARTLGRAVTVADYQRFMRIGDMLSVYTRAEEGRDAYSHEVEQYIRAEAACELPPLTYEQTPRPLVTANQRERTVSVSIENYDTVPDDLLPRLEQAILEYPTITEAMLADDPDCVDRLMRLLRAEFDAYLQTRNRNYLSYYFAVRRDMNELSMEEVRAWTGSGPNPVGNDALEFTGTAGTAPPPLYSGFTTKAAWSSDEIEQRQRDPRLRSDQVESIVLRMRDICRTRNFVLDGCKYTLNASAPVVNNCRTFVFKVLVPTDNGLRFRLLVRLFQKIDERGLSQWGYQVTEENSDVTIRAPRTYNNPEVTRQQEYEQNRRDQERAERIREQARRRAHAAMVGEPPPPAPPPPPARLSIKPDDEPLPEGRPLDL